MSLYALALVQTNSITPPERLLTLSWPISFITCVSRSKGLKSSTTTKRCFGKRVRPTFFLVEKKSETLTFSLEGPNFGSLHRPGGHSLKALARASFHLVRNTKTKGSINCNCKTPERSTEPGGSVELFMEIFIKARNEPK